MRRASFWVLLVVMAAAAAYAAAGVAGALAAEPPSLDAGPAAQEVDFSNEDEGLGGDELTPRDPAAVTFGSTIPERFRDPGGEGAPAPDAPKDTAAPLRTRPRGGCAGCAAAGTPDDASSGAAAALLALVLLVVRGRARRS